VPLGHDPPDAVQHQLIGAEIPARVQTDAEMGLSDRLDPVQVIRVVTPGEQVPPMRDLRLLQPVDGLSVQNAAQLRHAQQVVIERAQDIGKLRFDRPPGLVQQRHRRGIDSEKGQPVIEIRRVHPIPLRFIPYGLTSLPARLQYSILHLHTDFAPIKFRSVIFRI